MSNNRLLWEDTSSDGPRVAFAAGCLIGESLYLHGGVSEARSTKPLSTLYKFDIDQNVWQLVNSSGPTLSHHACISIGSHHIAFIGGWNGKERCSDVHIFDCEAEDWLEIHTSGFPAGAGLSSHTASLLSNNDILIIGREGSLRTQRKSGNAFVLSGSVEKQRFKYDEMAMSVASRSGHTTSILNNTLVVVGGRNDKLYEIHKIPHNSCAESSSLSVAPLETSLPRMIKLPCGRKHHSASIIANDAILIFGGETFDGRSKEPVSEVYIIDSKANYTWKYLDKTNIGRAGHVCVPYHNTLLVHGGIGEGNCVSNHTFKLKV